MTHKLALITGSTGGIGRTIAARLLDDDFDLIIASRSQERLDKTKHDLKSRYPTRSILTEICQVGDLQSVQSMFERIKSAEMAIDVLVNCAGISGGGLTKDIDPAAWVNVINTNLNGTFFVTQTLLKQDLMASGGRIINIASTGGKQGVLYGAPYCASKHGVVGFSKALGLELARNGSGITVNAICPGFVETEMAERVREHYAKIWKTDDGETKRRVEQRVPIGRYVEPSEVAAMVSYIASDAASAVTAQALNVCGGLGNY